MFLEIIDQPHKRWAEGSSNTKPTVFEIKAAIAQRNYVASNIEIFYDDTMGFWRFSAYIERV